MVYVNTRFLSSNKFIKYNIINENQAKTKH